MTTVGQREDEVDAGRLAVLGHRLLGSAAVVTGAMATLRDGNGSISAAQQELLEGQVQRNLASITQIARTLIHGEAAERPRVFCAQCYGTETVRIDGKLRPCTCVSWSRVIGPRDGGGAPLRTQ
jgi:hypothetical protein